MNVFFTSDQHFNHSNIIKYCKRPFADAEEMNEYMIEKHNSIVTQKDTVYHLGDFCFSSKPEQFLSRLNGATHILILGNHDHKNVNALKRVFTKVYDTKLVAVGNDKIFLNHYAQLTWPNKHYGAYHLFGHSHGTLQGIVGSLDIGVDQHGFFPIPWEDIKDVIDNERAMLNP